MGVPNRHFLQYERHLAVGWAGRRQRGRAKYQVCVVSQHDSYTPQRAPDQY